ncbi:hypothetical protein IGI86_002617 [Enterococcus sp. AZ188]|uniref:DUF7006 family protein n=1 Tax=Enterococcus sp. AZ188 TaxID=2774678 RepID=UPI003D2FE431
MNQIEQYLTYFDDYFEESIFLQRHPTLAFEYQSIRNEFIDLAEYDIKKEPLEYITDLLSIDAKLQILYELCQCLEAMSLNDSEIVTIVKNDSKYYYLENFGKAKNDPFPYSLLFFNNFIDNK